MSSHHLGRVHAVPYCTVSHDVLTKQLIRWIARFSELNELANHLIVPWIWLLVLILR